ncbi:MAG: glycosyltransferase family 4 protein [Bacillota bacterium]|nr:glycosyltransferase family 4 protein [Bacillota bacterium]
MKITYLLPGLGRSGGNIVLYHFMDGLASRGHDITAVAPEGRFEWSPGCWHQLTKRASQKPFLRRSIVNLGKLIVRGVARVTVADGLEDIVRATRMIRALLKNSPKSNDVIIASFCWTAFAGYYLPASRWIYHMQHMEELFFISELGRKIARLSYFLPFEQVANSKWLNNWVAALTNKRPNLILNPGIDTNVFSGSESFVRRKYSGQLRPFRILTYVDPGRIWKGFDDAVAAMKLVTRAISSDAVEWILFGFGDPGAKVAGVPYKFLGTVFGKDLANLYASVHAVLCPSWYESFPLPPLEAMACGTAVVTTCYGVEDYALDGLNALVVPPRDHQRTAEALLRLINNPDLCTRLALAGIETAKSFSWDRAIRMLEEFLSLQKPADLPDQMKHYKLAARLGGLLAGGGFDVELLNKLLTAGSQIIGAEGSSK